MPGGDGTATMGPWMHIRLGINDELFSSLFPQGSLLADHDAEDLPNIITFGFINTVVF